MKKARKVLLTERDISILKFMWRYKVITSAVACHRWFSGKARAACVRLSRLERGGYIQSIWLRQNYGHVWGLTKRGFESVREEIEYLEKVSYRSEYPHHDYLVAALQVGPWLIEKPKEVDICTEHELRSIDPKHLEAWVPKSPIHRPDGYWCVLKPSRAPLCIALEVETISKIVSRYEAVGSFYSFEESVHRVIWLVKNRTLAHNIQTKFSDVLSARSNVHNFVLVSDFKNQHWQAKFFLGPDQGKSISDFFKSLGLSLACLSTVERQARPFLDTRKRCENDYEKQIMRQAVNS